ncbi:MAG: hypothetical protein HZC41_17020 [Chloroflexi bacterium]|nr:hypothetical protein [Chloroflexota bacterium]
MFPQMMTQQQTERRDDYPTSPWTETFQSCLADSATPASYPAMQPAAADNDTQSPTHDALSAIYNQGY